MSRRTVRQSVILVVAVGIATSFAYQLHQHHVGVSLTVAVFFSTVLNGFVLATWPARPERTFTCPEPGCGLIFTTVGGSAAENTRLHALAVDHSQHGTAAV